MAPVLPAGGGPVPYPEAGPTPGADNGAGSVVEADSARDRASSRGGSARNGDTRPAAPAGVGPPWRVAVGPRRREARAPASPPAPEAVGGGGPPPPVGLRPGLPGLPSRAPQRLAEQPAVARPVLPVYARAPSRRAPDEPEPAGGPPGPAERRQPDGFPGPGGLGLAGGPPGPDELWRAGVRPGRSEPGPDVDPPGPVGLRQAGVRPRHGGPRPVGDRPCPRERGPVGGPPRDPPRRS
mmetsp:Transcript_23148/g.33185  ORF Transcript_23148/g.33185 Transcript_23148/m.33185 type:complete len:238 (-) Transcript_23148:1181-1894(-)